MNVFGVLWRCVAVFVVWVVAAQVFVRYAPDAAVVLTALTLFIAVQVAADSFFRKHWR